ncbi:hypothetical protein [Haloglomus litoreum]|uniref:hypothetical protein n=1 Tax=Haloglomus litoreum TaxID=3034026 RepID=UPI0023E828F1|nr:hypothetical protein [Haloglomus sp. DT116]
MSASGAGGPRVRRLFDRAKNAGSIGGVIFQGLSAVLLAIGTVLASGVFTLADIFIKPAQSFATESAGLVESFLGSFGIVIDFGAIASARSIGPGGLFASPLSLPIAFAIIGLSAYVIIAITSEEETTNFFPLIGSGFNLPTPGFTDAEEEEEG